MTAHSSHELRRTSVLALVGLLFLVVAIFIVFSVATGDPQESCSWCKTNAFDEAVRSALRWEDSRRPAFISHIVSLAVAPIPALGLVIVPAIRARRGWHGLRSFFVVINVFLLTTAMADGVKKLFGRERPGFAHGRAALIEAAKAPLERNMSFFSGDTAWVFTFAAVATSICWLRGYNIPRWVPVFLFSLGAVEAYLRIAADMHWATDVLAGAVVGTLVGSLPLLVHKRVGDQPGSLQQRNPVE